MSDCVFCEIVKGRIPSIRVHEDDDFLVLMDINPVVAGHCLIITKEHFPATSSVPDDLLAKALPLAKRLADAALLGVGAEAYNLIVNNGRVSGQEIDHWHMHVIPRKSRAELPLKTGDPADLTQLPFVADAIRSNL
jgi:histidine triad (HIT) family protein